MTSETLKQTIINEFAEYLKIYYSTNQQLRSRRLTFLSVHNCDICDKSEKKYNPNNDIHCVELYPLQGIQCCLNCFEKHPQEYYLYIMSLKEKMIPQKLFKKIILILKPDIDFNAINVKRSNGDIETWKLNDYDINVYDDDNIHVKVVTLDDKISKTNDLETFCEINDINYDEAFDLFKQLYFDVSILSWGEYLNTLTTKQDVINTLNQRYNNNNNYIDQAISVKDEDAVRLLIKYNIN